MPGGGAPRPPDRPASPRQRGEARQCAYCHGPFLPGEERWACEVCATALHAECAAGLDRCPALGCAGAPPGQLPGGRVSWARLVADAGPWLEVGDALRANDAWGPMDAPGPALDDEEVPPPSSAVLLPISPLGPADDSPAPRGPRQVPWEELVDEEGPWPSGTPAPE